ncbi:MAG TPA: redoxin domain-containing protein [Phycisphaerales bacterium]|nr:redoxin domain-containing protein [Phycisphaerales bacterium]
MVDAAGHKGTGVIAGWTMRLILCAICLLGSVAIGGVDPYRRLGGDERLAALAALETKPFPVDLLASLDGWTGEPITPERLEGRVLLLMGWANDDPRSVRLLPRLARLHRERGDEVLVLAVHQRDGWDSALERIGAGRVRCPAAHDAEGALLEALHADASPNVYLVDRAGMIRVADIDPRDMLKAVGRLMRETPEQARADLPRRVERLAEIRELLPDKTADPESGDAAGDEAAGGVSPGAYKSAPWPDPNLDRLSALNVQGHKLPVPLGGEKWLTPEPDTPIHSRVVVIDFWATWCRPCLRAGERLDELQKKYKDDLLVMKIAGQSAGEKYPEDEAAIRAFLRDHPSPCAELIDPSQKLFSALKIRGIPHCLILSTDGVVRWQGNPLSPRFPKALEQIIRADPLLAARRAGAGEAPDDDG